MTLRLEEKIYIKNLNLFEFKKWMNINNIKKIFPTRIVNSIYFDNDLKMYFDSIEGVLPRKKIRIRTYGTKNFLITKNKIKKEIKISYYNYRKKIVDDVKLNSSLLQQVFFDEIYGICKPIINVFYKRSYFKLKEYRITIDEEINYSKVSNSFISKPSIQDTESIIEIKSNNIFKKDDILKNFPLARSRFSKYCRGIELLKIF